MEADLRVEVRKETGKPKQSQVEVEYVKTVCR